MNNGTGSDNYNQKITKRNEKKQLMMDNIKSLEEKQLTLRKQKILKKHMDKRKSYCISNEFQLNPLSLTINQTEIYVDDDLKHCPFSFASIIHILDTTNIINNIKYILAKIIFHCDINDYIIPKELSLVLIKCLFTDYQSIQNNNIIRYNIISIFINLSVYPSNYLDYLLDKMFLVNLYNLIINEYSSLDLQTDILWLLNNMIKTPELLELIISSIKLMDGLNHVYKNPSLKEEGICIVLGLVQTIITHHNQNEICMEIITEMIPLFVNKWKDYSSSMTSEFLVDLQKQNRSKKLIKAIIILMATALRKSNDIITILNNQRQTNQFYDTLLEIISLYNLSNINNTGIKQETTSLFKIKSVQQKLKEHLSFESKSPMIISILIIIAEVLYNSSNEIYDYLIEKKLLERLEHILHQLLIYNKSNHSLLNLNDIVYNLTIIFINFVSQDKQYAQRFLFNTSLLSSLVKLDETVGLTINVEREIIMIIYNIFILNDHSINHFFFSHQQKELCGFSIIDFPISIFTKTQDDETIIVLLNLLNLFLQYLNKIDSEKEKADFKLFLESRDILILFEKYALSSNEEISNLSTNILTDLINDDEIEEINMKLDQDNEEDYDY